MTRTCALCQETRFYSADFLWLSLMERKLSDVTGSADYSVCVTAQSAEMYI